MVTEDNRTYSMVSVVDRGNNPSNSGVNAITPRFLLVISAGIISIILFVLSAYSGVIPVFISMLAIALTIISLIAFASRQSVNYYSESSLPSHLPDSNEFTFSFSRAHRNIQISEQNTDILTLKI